MTDYVPVDVIEVRVWGRTVGAVALDPLLGVYAFEFDDAWVDSGVELSPLVMPNRKRDPYVFPDLRRDTFAGLPGLLADSLPDAFGNAVIDAWLANEGIAKGQITTLDRLAYAGTRAMGALTFHPAAAITSGPATALQIADLVVGARAVIAGQVEGAQSTTQALHQLIQVGASAGGARAKAIVQFNPDTEQIRSGYADVEPGFGNWLMKLDGVSRAADGSANALDAPEQFTRIEYAYALMARAAGVTMTECRLLREGSRAHFLTRRFDRLAEGGAVHVQSLCAMNHMDFRFNDSHSYEQYFQVIAALGLGEEAMVEAYRRMVFNVAAVNRDDHTKNLAFLLPRHGAWSLAPAYDITHAYNPDGEWTQRHQMSVNGAFDNIGLADLYAVGDAFNIPGYKAATAAVLAAVAQWPDFAAQADVATAQSEHIATDMRRFRPV